MKKITSLILISLIILGCYGNSTALANSDIEYFDGYSSKYTFNEYTVMKDILKKTDDELYKMGYSVEDVKEMREINYEEIIFERYTKKYGKVQNNNLTAKEFVDTLTDEQIASIMANCSVSHRLDPRDFYYMSGENKTYARITFSWQWDMSPVFHGIDIVALGWDAQMYANTTTSFVNVNYGMDGSTHLITQTHRFTPYESYNVSDTFDLSIRPYGHGSTDPVYYAKNGSGTLHLYCAGKNQNLGVAFSYGHTWVGMSEPSISLSPGQYPIGVGFSFSFNVTQYKSPLKTGHIY